MSPLKFVALFLLVFAAPISAADETDPWQKLKNLDGTWQLTDPKSSEGKAFRITYRLISANTALVESFGNPAKQITATIYHRDGERLLATHYCAQGNQPRLRLQPSTLDDALQFESLDATNLKSADDSHLIRLRLELVDRQRLIRQEVYLENGKEAATTLSLKRVE